MKNEWEYVKDESVYLQHAEMGSCEFHKESDCKKDGALFRHICGHIACEKYKHESVDLSCSYCDENTLN